MIALAVFGGVIGVITLIVVSSVLNGYVLSVLWGWFVVPTFGAPQLSIAPAIGIALVVSYMTHQTHDCQKEDKSPGEKIAVGTAILVLKPLVALFFGWIVLLFM